MDFLKEFLDEFLRLVGIPFQILTPTREKKTLLWTLSADFLGENRIGMKIIVGVFVWKLSFCCT